MAPISSVFLGMDTTVTIECFVIVVIGGLGSTGGAFLGAIIFGLANSRHPDPTPFGYCFRFCSYGGGIDAQAMGALG